MKMYDEQSKRFDEQKNGHEEQMKECNDKLRDERAKEGMNEQKKE
jgi:hypothetical protein